MGFGEQWADQLNSHICKDIIVRSHLSDHSQKTVGRGSHGRPITLPSMIDLHCAIKAEQGIRNVLPGPGTRNFLVSFLRPGLTPAHLPVVAASPQPAGQMLFTFTLSSSATQVAFSGGIVGGTGARAVKDTWLCYLLL